jgi:hypothetical protein
MFGKSTLKAVINYREDQTPCPVKDCDQWVSRQRKRFLRESEFRCNDHQIYISRSTFEYADKYDNLLWTAPEDRALLDAIGKVKRESRMARDNSEDAVTWNVVRFLETSGLLGAWLESIAGVSVKNPRMIYWSFCQDSKALWPKLVAARAAFDEDAVHGSEPDLVVNCESTVFFIEAKLTSGNHTTPSDPSRRTRYESGGNGWFSEVIATDFNKIAVEEKRYELMRLWLLGSWAATELKKPFYLVNLVRDESERSIVKSLAPHLKSAPNRQFLRATWENIHRFVDDSRPRPPTSDTLLRYMLEKTLGYDNRGRLRSAFAL